MKVIGYPKWEGLQKKRRHEYDHILVPRRFGVENRTIPGHWDDQITKAPLRWCMSGMSTVKSPTGHCIVVRNSYSGYPIHILYGLYPVTIQLLSLPTWPKRIVSVGSLILVKCWYSPGLQSPFKSFDKWVNYSPSQHRCGKPTMRNCR